MLSNIGEFPAVFWTRGLVMKTENKEQPRQGNSEVLSSAAVARRHALLKGLSRGSVVLATALPLQTLSAKTVFTHTGKNGEPVVQCGGSGQMSGVGSRTPDDDDRGDGYSPGYYKFPDKHPWPFGTDPETPCKDIFHGCLLEMPAPVTPPVKVHGNAHSKPTPPTPHVPASLVYVLLNDENSDYYHWITAWLNGMGGAPASFNFPYTGPEVIAFYNGTGPYSAAQALEFFKTYMELK